jgi:hypothetical protein
MPIFAVMGLGNAALGAKVREQFPDDYFVVGPDKWFVAESGATAASVAEKLGMSPSGGILGVVVTVGGYNGLAPTNIWEWIKAKGSIAAGA